MRRRAFGWLAWWAAMMALWVMIDDSLRFDELLAGAGAAALAALGAELATGQAAVGFRPGPVRPLAAEALKVPGQVARDTAVVFAALARTLASGGARQPAGGFAEVPLPASLRENGLPTEAGRVLLTGIRSVAPNTFVLDLDERRGVLVVHHLAAPGGQR
ncbi:MAG: Na+/H+ antiporter subunit E [Nocardiopsaceae bacterium]|nr:Na+/H+ antiporter subunit E [Nocardiopsaceae bacterium]